MPQNGGQATDEELEAAFGAPSNVATDEELAAAFGGEESKKKAQSQPVSQPLENSGTGSVSVRPSTSATEPFEQSKNPNNQFLQGLPTEQQIATGVPKNEQSAREYEVSQRNLVGAQKGLDYSIKRDKEASQSVYQDVQKSEKWTQGAAEKLGHAQFIADQNIEKLKESVKPELDYVAENLKDFTRIAETDTVADELKINDYAVKRAKELGLPEDGYFKDFLYNSAKAQVAHKIIEPKVLKERDKLLKEQGLDVKKLMPEKFDKGEEIQAQAVGQINSVIGEVEKLAKADIDSVASRVNTQVNQLNQAYEQQSATVQDQQQSEQLYSEYKANFDKLQKDFLDAQNQINGKYNARIRRQADEIEKVASQKWEEEAAKFGDEYNANVDKLKKATEQAYKNVSKSEQTVKNVRDMFTPPVMNFGRTTLSSLGRSVGNYSQTFGYDYGKVLGDYLENSYQPGTTELNSWKDLLDANMLSKSAGQLTGAMLPSMTATVATTMATGGLNAPVAVQMIAGAGAAWLAESADMAGNMYRETFKETGDANKALKKSKQMWDAQMASSYLYTLEGLPFVGKSLSLSKNVAKRMIGGAAGEFITETGQEYFQNEAEDAIKTKDDWTKAFDSMTLNELGHTALQVAPVALLGAQGQIRGEKTEQETINDEAKSFVLKTKFNEIAPDQRGQFLSEMVRKKGDTFTAAYINQLYSNGKIDKETASDLVKDFGIAKEVQLKAKEYGMNEADQKVFTAFKYKLINAQEQAANETDPILKQAAENKVKELEEQTVNFASGKQADYVVLTYPNNEQYVLSLSQAQNAAKNPKLIKSIQSGDMKVDGVGKGVEVVNGIAEGIKAEKKAKVDAEKAGLVAETGVFIEDRIATQDANYAQKAKQDAEANTEPTPPLQSEPTAVIEANKDVAGVPDEAIKADTRETKPAPAIQETEAPIWQNTKTDFQSDNKETVFKGKSGKNYRITEQEGETPNDIQLYVYEKDNKKPIGLGHFKKNSDGSFSVDVNEGIGVNENGRDGIASAMYDYIDTKHGQVKQSKSLSGFGKNLWNKNKILNNEKRKGSGNTTMGSVPPELDSVPQSNKNEQKAETPKAETQINEKAKTPTQDTPTKSNINDTDKRKSKGSVPTTQEPIRVDDTKDFSEGRKFALDYVLNDLVDVKPLRPKMTAEEAKYMKGKKGRVEDGKKVKNIRKAAKDVSQRVDWKMKNEERHRAIRDIKKGKYNTVSAKMLLDRLEQFHDNGYFDFIAGTGRMTVQAGEIPIADIKAHLAEVKALKAEVYAEYTPEEVAYFAEQDALINEMIEAIEEGEINEQNIDQQLKQKEDENERAEKETTEDGTGQDVGEPQQEAAPEKVLTDKEKAQKELSDAMAALRKKLGAGSGVQLQALPEFIAAVKAAIKAGYYTAKEFIADFKESFPNHTEQEIEDAFNEVNKAEDLEKGMEEGEKKDGKKEKSESREKRKLAQQFLNSSDISQKFKEAITEDAIYYDRFPNNLSLQDANAFLETYGEEEARKAVLDLSNGMRFAPRMILGQVLIKKMNAKGYDAEAVEFSEKFFELSTELGQGIQALSLFQFLTPEGQVKAAQKVVKKMRDKQIKGSYKQIKKLKAAVDKANKEAAEEVVKKVAKKIKKAASIEVTDISSPQYGSKNKIVTKSEYSKLLKELRGNTFLNVDPRVVKIAAYHIEAGSREFATFSENMVKTLGKKVKPYLKDLYKQAQDLFDDKEGFTTDENILKAENEAKGQEIKEKISKALKSGNKKSIEEAIAEISQNGELWGKYKDMAVKRLQQMSMSEIQGDIKQKAVLDEFTQGLIKNIREQAEKKGEGKSVEKKPAIQIIADAYKNFEKYQEVWEQTKKDFAEKNKDNPEKLAELDAYFGDITLKPFSENLVKQSIDDVIGNRIKEIINLKAKGFDTSSFEDEVVEKLIFETGLAEEEIREYIEAVKDEINTRKNEAQSVLDKKKQKAEEKKQQIVKKAQSKKTKPLWTDRRERAISSTIKNLENRLFEASPTKKTAIEEFTNRLISNIGGEIRNQIQTKGKAGIKDDIQLLVEVLKNKDTYNDVLSETQKQIIEKYKDNPTALLQFDDALFKILESPFYESITKRIVRQGLKDLDIKIGEIIKAHYTVYEDYKRSLVNKLIDDAGLSPQEANELAKEIEKEFDKLALEKRKQYLDKALNQKQRAKPNVKQLYEKLLEISNVGVLSDNQFNELYAQKMGYATLTAEQANKIKELAEKVQNAPDGHLKFRAIEDLLKYHANLKGVNYWEIPLAWWYASVLSGHQTQQRNIIANVANTMMLYANAAIQSRSPLFLAKAAVLGMKKGWLEAQDVLQTGYSPIRGKIEVPPVLERIKFEGWKYPANAAKYVRRAMVAADVLFFEAQKEMRAYQLALVQARKEGKLDPTLNERNRTLQILNASNGAFEVAIEQAQLEMETKLQEIENSTLSAKEKAKEKKAAEHAMQRRAYDILNELRPTSIKDESATFASKGTYNYTPQGLLGAMAKSLNSFSDKAWFVRLVVPFVNIISNVANDALNYTPYGFARYATLKNVGENEYEGGSLSGKLSSKEFNENITEQERADMLYKAAMGVAFTAAFLMLSAADDDEEPVIEVTANGTGDWRKNLELRETGWQPYSVRFKKPSGGYTDWVSYQYSPLILALGWVGNIRDFEKYRDVKIDDSFISKYGAATSYTMRSIFDMSFLNSADKMLSGIFDIRNENKAEDAYQALQKSAKAFVVPNAYTQSAKMMQDYFDMGQKETRGTWLGYTLRDIPVARGMYKDQINVLGEPVQPDSDVLFSGSEASKELQLLVDKNVFISQPNPLKDTYLDEKDGWKEKEFQTNPEKFYQYAKERGTIIKDFVSENYDYLRTLPKKDVKRIMTHVQQEATNYAKINTQGYDIKPDFNEYMEKQKGNIEEVVIELTPYEEWLKVQNTSAKKSILKSKLEEGSIDEDGIVQLIENGVITKDIYTQIAE